MGCQGAVEVFRCDPLVGHLCRPWSNIHCAPDLLEARGPIWGHLGFVTAGSWILSGSTRTLASLPVTLMCWREPQAGAPGRQVATQRPSPPTGSCLAPLTPALMAATNTFRIREEREAAFPMWIRDPSTSQHAGVLPVWSHSPVPRGDRSSSRCPHRCFAISGPGFTPAPGGLKSKRRQGLRFFQMSLVGVLVHLLKQGSARSRPAVCPFIRGRARLGPLLRERQRGQRSSHFSGFSRHVASHSWSISDGARIR